MSKEPRTSTFSVGQRVKVQHSNLKYDNRQGVIANKIGGGVYAVDMPARTRTIFGKNGGSRQVEDPAETKTMKLGSIKRVCSDIDDTAPSPFHGLQALLFRGF